MSVYKFDYVSLEGKETSMKNYEGNVLLIVNTASKCGFAPQYEGLESLYKRYHEQGFNVIGFPSGQFNDQEFDDTNEIQEFCSVRYGVTFPMSQKVDVRGEHKIPLFAYLSEEQPFVSLGKGIKATGLKAVLKVKYGKEFSDNQIKWNFTKFLVDRNGKVIKRYESIVEPKDIAKDIENLL